MAILKSAFQTEQALLITLTGFLKYGLICPDRLPTGIERYDLETLLYSLYLRLFFSMSSYLIRHLLNIVRIN